ncbi:hypothetical protein [uncultured Friedmanniella sp.]
MTHDAAESMAAGHIRAAERQDGVCDDGTASTSALHEAGVWGEIHRTG